MTVMENETAQDLGRSGMKDSPEHLRSLSGAEWPAVVGKMWDESKSRFATKWGDLSHHDQLTVYRLLAGQEKSPTTEPFMRNQEPTPKPTADSTPTFLKFTIDKDGVEQDSSAEYFTLPRDEAVAFVEMYSDYDDWCGLGIRAHVRIVELSTIPVDELDEGGVPQPFGSAYDAAGDLLFEER